MVEAPSFQTIVMQAEKKCMCLLTAAVPVGHIQTVSCTKVACLWLSHMPSLIQLLAALLFKNKKWIPLPRLKSFWPSWILFNVAVRLARRRSIRPLHPDHILAGLTGRQKSLLEGLRAWKHVSCVSEVHWRIFLKRDIGPTGYQEEQHATPESTLIFLIIQTSSGAYSAHSPWLEQVEPYQCE